MTYSQLLAKKQRCQVQVRYVNLGKSRVSVDFGHFEAGYSSSLRMRRRGLAKTMCRERPQNIERAHSVGAGVFDSVVRVAMRGKVILDMMRAEVCSAARTPQLIFVVRRNTLFSISQDEQVLDGLFSIARGAVFSNSLRKHALFSRMTA
jgi:hypothetical protein